MADDPSALSGRKRVQVPNSFFTAQCFSLGSQLLNSPTRANACHTVNFQISQEYVKTYYVSMRKEIVSSD